MLEYGAACLIVCALSYFDRRAAPYAFTIATGWALGFLGWQFWPLISTGLACVTFWLHIKRTTEWSAAVSSLAAMMLLADVVYLWLRWHNVRVEVEYGHALDVGLICQLLLIGHKGALNGMVRVLSWVPDRFRHLRGDCSA